MRQCCKAMVNNSLIQEIARVKPPRSQRRRLRGHASRYDSL